MGGLNPWVAPALIAAALVLGTAIYAAVRWRRAPAAFRAIVGVASIWLLAGLLFGVSVFHFAFERTGADASKAEPEASPAPVARHEPTPIDRQLVCSTTRSIETAIYVASRDRVTTYALGSNGNVTPLTIISGSASGLTDASAITVDARGNIYVANSGYGTKTSINVYPPGSNGEVIPTRTIAGPATDLHEPTGIVVADDGTIYVTNGGFLVGDYVSSDGGVAVYSPGSNGNVGPRARIVGREYVRSFPHYWIYRPRDLRSIGVAACMC